MEKFTKNIKEVKKEKLKKIAAFGGIIAGVSMSIGSLITIKEYSDLPFPLASNDQGRTKNAIS
jgi:hypothetical protein